MQAKPKILRILVVALIVSLVLGACGGGNTGKTWFNLPSIPVRVQSNGVASVFGFNIGPVLQPSLIQQLQSANVQKLEIRIGYNGIHVYANGRDLPYISWSQESVATLQDVLTRLPNVPNGATIARVLPWLRTIGTGVALNLPPAQGAAPLDIPRWRGETTVSPESPAETTIGPFNIASLVFDPQGNAIIEGVPVSTLEQALGMALPLRLDPNTLSLLQSIGAEKVTIATHPNGIHLSLNDRPLPGIAYDSASLNQLLELAPAFVADPALLATLQDLVPQLPGAQISVVVSFTGEAVAETELAPISISVEPDGSLRAFGLPVAPEPVVPADVIQKLQAANVQRLRVQMASDGLFIAANEQTLPTITWTDESLARLAGLVGPLADVSPDLVTSALDIVRRTGISLDVQFPLAEGATPVEVPAEIDRTMEPPSLDGFAPPVLHVSFAYSQQRLAAINHLTSGDLAQVGVTLPDLPPELATVMQTLGVRQLALVTDPGQLNVLLDGQPALTVNYDAAALQKALDLAEPFLTDTPLVDPGVETLLREQILPLVPGADINVAVNVQ